MKKFNLSNISREDPFAVPDGYLQKLPHLIQEKVQVTTGTAPVRQWSLGQKILFLPQLHLAYTLLLFAVLTALTVQQPSAPEIDAQLLLQRTSQQEVLQYLSAYDNLSTQELAGEADLSSSSLLFQELPAEDALEEDIALHIDAYSAEELWKE